MDPWKDCLNFTDTVLDAFIKGFPSHPDHPAALAEFERRREECLQRDQVRVRKAEAITLGTTFSTWAIGWIAFLGLRFSKRGRLTA